MANKTKTARKQPENTKLKKSRKDDRAKRDSSRTDDGDVTSPDLLKKQKSYRRIAIYLTGLVILLAGAGGYWLFDSAKKSKFAGDCEAAKTRGEWANLELTAREWAMWEPDNPRPWLYAALAAESVGDERRQLEYLNQLPDSAPFEALLKRSDLQFRNNLVYDAADTFRELVRRRPDSKEAHRRLSFFYAMTLQRDKLIEESRRAIETGADVPQSYVYLVGADWITFTNGYQVNLQWASQYPKNTEIFEIASVMHLVASGVDQSMEEKDEKLRAALSQKAELVEKLRQKYPENEELVILDLRMNVHNANARRVGEILNSSEFDLENDSRIWRVIGWFHSYKEDWEEAEKAYLKCLELNPFDWQCRFEYTTVLRNLKKTGELEAMQESAALGKDIMRNVLQANNTVEIPKATLLQIVEYAKACGETEVGEKLEARLNGNAP